MKKILPRLLVSALSLSFISACSIKGGVVAPDVEVADGWQYAALMTSASVEAPSESWWTAFQSDELNDLVRIALANNTDVAAAEARLRQADAQITVAGSSLWPAVSISADSARNGVLHQGQTSKNYRAGVAASYELDMWGGQRAQRASAHASGDAAIYAWDAARTTVVASVVNSWLEVLALRQRIRVAQENVVNAEKVLAIVEAKYRHGAGSALSLAQQQGQVASQRAGIEPLLQQQRETTAALALLIGQTVQGFAVTTVDLSEVVDLKVITDLPSAVLARRPDVQQAEAQLRAADANVVVARAAMFPNLSVTGALGFDSVRSASLFDGDPTYGLTASLSQALFQGGRLKAQSAVARARFDELAAGYVGVVLAALNEADLALARVHALEEQIRWQSEQLAHAQRAYDLVETRYNAGGEGLLTVLEVQRSLFSAQDQHLQLRLARLQAQVTLYRALGAVPEHAISGHPVSERSVSGRSVSGQDDEA
ncbi:MAG: efflux transporter outer membrane subunit [Gammaproteobacteria bacterium]|nr:efflux transporter outer membrane subunit [Gammaproteobacteria bacterium]MBQ0774655.1 efflux transporter outer membrane subunit [Gammaproteobacteria bacterium]